MPDDKDSAFFTNVAVFDAAPSFAGDYVIRPGKLFECGSYPDKNFEFDESDLDRAVESFKEPAAIDLEHIPTVLEGKLGHVQRVWKRGKELMGEVWLPKWLDENLDERKVSATWDRATKTLAGLALVRNPRVSDAALMASFARHTTPSGQALLQQVHDMTASRGAICSKVGMSSRYEMDAVQQIHDLAASRGAKCEGGSYPRQVQYSRSTGMKVKDWLKAQFEKDGVETDEGELDALFGNGEIENKTPETTPAPQAEIEALKAELKKRDEQIAAAFGAASAKPEENDPEKAEFKRTIAELQERDREHAAALAKVEEERRKAEAVVFSNTQVQAHKISPPAAEKLAGLVAYLARTDATVTFADGEKSGQAMLVEFLDSLPDLSMLTTEQIKADLKSGGVIFNEDKTPENGKKEPTADDINKLLAMTPVGRTALDKKEGK